MKIQQLMTPNAQCISPDTVLQKAAEQMKNLNVGSLPICDNDRLVGMVTDRDIVTRGIADGKDITSTAVKEVMTPEITYCYEDQELNEVVRLMQDKKIRRLVVLNQDKRMVGMLSLGDIASHPESRENAKETLEYVSQS